MSAGLRARMAAELATLFAKNGAELRKLRPGSRLEVTWNFRREPIEVRYAPSPWVRFAAAREDGSWGITRAETEPDVRVAAVHGEVKSSLFEAIDDVGESPQLVMALRSEEHTSELQSLAYLVCRLLLEKKKKKKVNDTVTTGRGR